MAAIENAHYPISIVDYNPSFSDEHWLCDLNRDSRTYHFISTYKDNPFLEQTIIDEIESLQYKNQSLWQVYGLGQQAIVEGLIFPNIEIIDEFPEYAKNRLSGWILATQTIRLRLLNAEYWMMRYTSMNLCIGHTCCPQRSSTN